MTLTVKNDSYVRPTRFVYSIKFNGHNPVGAVALVVASTPKSAASLLISYMFMEEPSLYEKHKDHSDSLVPVVFCAAHPDQLAMVTILLNGEY